MSLKANPTPEILNTELNLVISLNNNNKNIAISLKFVFDKIRETFPLLWNLPEQFVGESTVFPLQNGFLTDMKLYS